MSALPETILFTLILAIAIIGSFAVSSSMFDVAACIGFGIMGSRILKKKIRCIIETEHHGDALRRFVYEKDC